MDPTDNIPPNTSDPLDVRPTHDEGHPLVTSGSLPAIPSGPRDLVIPNAEGKPEITRDSIHRYVWSRYVDYGPAPFVLSEEEALAFLERHYQEHPLAEDAECFYYGILAYEHSFAAPPELRDSYLARAVEAFTAYRDQVVGPVWEPVADRLEDARELLARPPAGSP